MPRRATQEISTCALFDPGIFQHSRTNTVEGDKSWTMAKLDQQVVVNPKCECALSANWKKESPGTRTRYQCERCFDKLSEADQPDGWIISERLPWTMAFVWRNYARINAQDERGSVTTSKPSKKQKNSQALHYGQMQNLKGVAQKALIDDFLAMFPPERVEHLDRVIERLQAIEKGPKFRKEAVLFCIEAFISGFITQGKARQEFVELLRRNNVVIE
jgi:hypothetical protein